VDSPEEKALKRQLEISEETFQELEAQLQELNAVIQELEQRDNEVYRVILESDPPPSWIRQSGLPIESERYEKIRGLSNETLLERSLRKVDDLKKRLAVHSASLDEVAELAQQKGSILKALPAIRPVKDQPDIRFSSGFGYRIDPIFKLTKMHQGVDFSAKQGTPIYATADGVVVSNELYGGRGYGNHLTISHGFGYHTLYAHMSKMVKRQGQSVSRGDLIGYVGNTGKSTGPHLHYEVIYRGRRVNPINFFFNDLTPEDYNKLVAQAAANNQSFD
jgi:murein DD-endopeptidase MepM/ murein hydrolase activator NlpD